MVDKMIRLNRKPLTSDMKIRISKELQLRALEEIGHYMKTDELGANLVFHGGTSLSIIHGSPRWSEDLDFMGAPETVRKLMARSANIEAALQLRSSLIMPGSSVSLTSKMTNPQPKMGDVDRLRIRWEHPGYLGAVKVKVEFYICPPERIAAYSAEVRRPEMGGTVSRSELLAATPRSIWADKIVAMAQRPALKHRDIHDLGFLHPLVSPDDDREDALSATMGIYGRTAQEIHQGLARDLVTEGRVDFEGYRENMARWFSEAEMAELEKTGRLRQLFSDFEAEFAIGQGMVSEMALEAAPEDAGESVGCSF